MIEEGDTYVRTCSITDVCTVYVCVLLCLVTTEMDSNKKQAEADRRKYDELVHERDMLNKVCVCVHCGYNGTQLTAQCFLQYVCTYVRMCVHPALSSAGCRP